MKNVLFVLGVIALSACSSVPRGVRGDVTEVTVGAVQANANQFVGVPVRWGGVIAQMQIKDGMSKVEIVEKPLSSYGRPIEGNFTGGRFIAIFSGFMDPMIFSVGREITVMGSVQEVIEGKISEQTYAYPVLAASGHHLWEERKDYYDTTVIVRGGYWDPFYRPIWWGHPYYHPHPVVIRPRPRYSGPNYPAQPSAPSQIPAQNQPPTQTQPEERHDPSEIRRPPKHENWDIPKSAPPRPVIKSEPVKPSSPKSREKDDLR